MATSKKVTPTATTVPTADERARMIAEAAYYRALHRGFQNGSQDADWHAAEREIDSLIQKLNPAKGR